MSDRGTVYTFGDFTLAMPGQRLEHRGSPVVVNERHLSVLGHLLTHAGTVVSKEALIAAGWGGIAVTDNSLEKAVSALRRLLGADRGRLTIETVTRHGYRFVGDVAVSVRESDASLEALLAPHRAFVEGRAALESLERDAITRARAVFESVVAEIPHYAPARLGLANACILTYEMTRVSECPDAEALAHAVRHARDACRLDADSAEAWATLGFVLDRTGASRDAVAACRRAVALDPATWRHHLRLATVSWGDERLRAAQRTLALFPGFPQAHWLAATVHVARQAFTEAERELRTGLTAVEGQLAGGARFSGVGLHWLLGLLHLKAGETTQALEAFARELAEEPHGHLYARESCANSWYALAVVRLRHGDRVAAQEALHETLRRTPHHPLALAALSSLRAEAQFGGAVEASGAASTPLAATMESAFAGAARHVLRGDHPAAAQIVAAALTAAPPGSAGWWLPLEPLLEVTARPDVWSGVLTLLRVRAM